MKITSHVPVRTRLNGRDTGNVLPMPANKNSRLNTDDLGDGTYSGCMARIGFGVGCVDSVAYNATTSKLGIYLDEAFDVLSIEAEHLPRGGVGGSLGEEAAV